MSVRGTRISRITVSDAERGIEVGERLPDRRHADSARAERDAEEADHQEYADEHDETRRPARHPGGAGARSPSWRCGRLEQRHARSASAFWIAAVSWVSCVGVVTVGVHPVRRPRHVRLGLGRLDVVPGRLLLTLLEGRRVRPVVDQQQVGLVLVGVLPAEVLPVGEALVRLVGVDDVEAPALEVEQLGRVLRVGDIEQVIGRRHGQDRQAGLGRDGLLERGLGGLERLLVGGDLGVVDIGAERRRRASRSPAPASRSSRPGRRRRPVRGRAASCSTPSRPTRIRCRPSRPATSRRRSGRA